MTQVGMETQKMGRLHFVVLSILRQTISTLNFASNFSSSGHCSHVCSFLTRDQNFEKRLVRDVLHMSNAKHIPSFFMTSLVQTARHKITAFTDLKTWHFNQMDQKVCYASNYPYFNHVGSSVMLL